MWSDGNAMSGCGGMKARTRIETAIDSAADCSSERLCEEAVVEHGYRRVQKSLCVWGGCGNLWPATG
eukprot:6194723-Pleurochrysis_carterae.AAC.1